MLHEHYNPFWSRFVNQLTLLKRYRYIYFFQFNRERNSSWTVTIHGVACTTFHISRSCPYCAKLTTISTQLLCSLIFTDSKVTRMIRSVPKNQTCIHFKCFNINSKFWFLLLFSAVTSCSKRFLRNIRLLRLVISRILPLFGSG